MLTVFVSLILLFNNETMQPGNSDIVTLTAMGQRRRTTAKTRGKWRVLYIMTKRTKILIVTRALDLLTMFWSRVAVKVGPL